MSAVIRKIVTVVEETHLEMGQTVAPPTRRGGAPADAASGRHRGDREPVRRPVCRRSLAADRHWRGTWRSALEKGRRRARDRRCQGAELRQGGCCRRERRTRTRGGDLASENGCAGAQGARQGRGADTVIEKTQRAGDDTGYPARPQGCSLRA